MKVSIRLLGGFTVAIDGTNLDLTDLSRRSRELVQLVALSPEHRTNRDRVIEQIFGHLGPEAGAPNLHKAASLARRLLGSKSAVTISDGWVSLWPEDTVDVDIDQFEAKAAAALSSGDADRCLQAASLYRGDLLPGSLHEEWALDRRRQLRLLYLELLRRAEDWERLSAAEPTDEEAARALMRQAAANGDRARVVDRFRTLREALAQQLAISPSPDTVAVYEELTRGPAVVAPVTDHTTLVGRVLLMTTAMNLLEKTARGAGGGLLVRGEAGIGKTRFCEEILTRASKDGWTTLRGSGSRVEAGIPFLPIAEAVDRLAAGRPDLVDRLPPPARAALARVTVAALNAGGPTPEQLGPQQVVSAVARLVAAAARERPVLVFFDDLHAADVDTIRLAHHLMRSAIFQRVLVVAASRANEESSLTVELRRELLASGRVSEIEVPPLDPGEADEFVAQRAARGVASDEVRSMWLRAGGNPFFLGELAANPAVGDKAPRSVTAAVQARLGNLAAGHVAVLELVAVLGESFTGDELAAVAGLEPQEARSLLDDALAAEILEESRTRTAGGLRFRHPLVREALLENLPEHRLTAAHIAAARMWESTGGGAGRVAHHLLAAGRGAEAGHWLVKAASDAASVGAFSGAAELLDQAWSGGGRDPELLRLRAELAYATADPDAPRMFTEAMAASPPSDAPALLIRRAGAFVTANEPGRAAASLAAVGEVSEDDLALLQLTNSQVNWMTGDLETALEWAETARHTALSRGQMDVVTGAINMLDLILHQTGGWADRFRHDLIRAEDSPMLATYLYDAHLCGAEMYLYGGRPHSELTEFAQDLADRARSGGARRGLAFAETLLGEIALLSGDLDLAAKHLTTGVELHREIGSPGGEALAKQRLAQTLLAGGKNGEVADLLSDALTLAGSAGAMAWHVVARVYATMVDAAPDSETALTVVDQAEADIGGGMAKACPSCSVPYWIAAAVACADGGRLADAKRFVARAAPRVAAVWPSGGWEAALNEARGHIALAVGDREGARSMLEQALAGFERVGQRVDYARCVETLTLLAD